MAVKFQKGEGGKEKRREKEREKEDKAEKYFQNKVTSFPKY